jgi:PAS domain S-box-containing protein
MIVVAVAVACSASAVALGVIATSPRRRLGDEIARYYSASQDLLATLALSGRFTRANSAWERTLGYGAESIRAHTLSDLVHSDERASVRAKLDRVASGRSGAIQSHNRFRATDGKYRWLEWSVSALPSRGVMHVIARDITAQRVTQQQLASSARWLESRVAERTHELDDTRAETLQLLCTAVEYRDQHTYQHTERVRLIAAEIATQLGLGADQIKRLREAAGLHDIGMIAIPDSILLKPGNLTAEEQRVMQRHAALGARLLAHSGSPVLQTAAVIAASHHEWWNGCGYPAGLAGERIPLLGRIVAVADVFDALTHERPYMSAWPVEQALARIERGSASQFDPRVVSAFLALYKDARAPSKGAALR